jgi:hypothetical protein
MDEPENERLSDVQRARAAAQKPRSGPQVRRTAFSRGAVRAGSTRPRRPRPPVPPQVKAARPGAGSDSGPRSASGLFGQDDISAEVLVLGSQGAEVDAASNAAPFGVLPVPHQVVVARLLLTVGWGLHELVRGTAERMESSPNSGHFPVFRRPRGVCPASVRSRLAPGVTLVPIGTRSRPKAGQWPSPAVSLLPSLQAHL